ncbi:MAG TPA: TetR/AcrR family transcriptional regulator [Pseudolysinimonas sp.]|nr:TetR/AcrR family transcriptional regulator [Pseudolysinimonas sp.]
MPEIQLSTRTDAIALIRNEPVQARSTARLAALLDAAAQVVHEIGYERLTTAMVAERAGASIGTVYRYFPDRIAVLQSLAARNAERVTDRMLAQLRSEQHPSWGAALDAALAVYVGAFREEPGFASLRYGDVLDLRPTTEIPALAVLAGQMFDALATRFGLDASDRTRAAFEAAIVATDAIAAHAFVVDPNGSAGYLELGTAATHSLISEYWG